MAPSTKTNPVYHFLMTSLFYPAVRGVVFYSMLESFSHIGRGLGLLLPLAYIGIVISFSIDFIYTYSSGSTCTFWLFLADMFVLLLLVVGYTSLIDALRTNTPSTTFLTAYGVIHAIFICWDLALIPRADVSL